MYIINIEAGMPTVEEARERLKTALLKAKKENKKLVKVIHGYGSTGKGDKLKTELRKSPIICHRLYFLLFQSNLFKFQNKRG